MEGKIKDRERDHKAEVLRLGLQVSPAVVNKLFDGQRTPNTPHAQGHAQGHAQAQHAYRCACGGGTKARSTCTSPSLRNAPVCLAGWLFECLLGWLNWLAAGSRFPLG